MRARDGTWVALLSAIAVIGASTAARAQTPDPAIGWDVPCGEPWAFVAGVAELGGSFEGFEVAVGVTETDAGAFVGRLSIARAGQPLAERELSDTQCADVVDALVIAAALALRSLPAAPPPPVPAPVEIGPVAPPDDEAPPGPAVEAPPPASPSVRFGIGASFRGGLGPTPGVALAPVIALALEVDRVVVALHFAYWPEAGATLADGQRGVVLWALTSTVEVGYRIGDAVSFVPSLVVEPSAAVARGIGVAGARSEATLTLDAGASAALTFDVDRVRLFVRGDLLFGLVQPAYGVEGERVFSSPVVRGTGGAGLFVFF